MKIEYDEGYQFGIGAFETIAVENGRGIFLEWHLERLREALTYLGIERDITLEEIAGFISNQDQPLEHHALKIIISACNTVITVRPNPYSEVSRKRGISLLTAPMRRNEFSELTRRKTLNYGECILAKRWAVSAGGDEALMLNSQGQVCEGATSNIFILKQGKLYTPPVECGVLPGTVRRYLIEHYPVEETPLLPEDLVQADACFATNALMGLTQVRSIDGIKLRGIWDKADSVNQAIFGKKE